MIHTNGDRFLGPRNKGASPKEASTMTHGDLIFVVAALTAITAFSVWAAWVEQSLWRRCRRDPECLRLQQQITLGKAHCR
jgi:hypothetical protein